MKSALHLESPEALGLQRREELPHRVQELEHLCQLPLRVQVAAPIPRDAVVREPANRLTMSKQALQSATLRADLKAVLLGAESYGKACTRRRLRPKCRPGRYRSQAET